MTYNLKDKQTNRVTDAWDDEYTRRHQCRPRVIILTSHACTFLVLYTYASSNVSPVGKIIRGNIWNLYVRICFLLPGFPYTNRPAMGWSHIWKCMNQNEGILVSFVGKIPKPINAKTAENKLYQVRLIRIFAQSKHQKCKQEKRLCHAC